MGKRHGGLSVLGCLLCAGTLLPSIAAWHPDPARPDGIRSNAGVVHGTPAHHYALPPLSAPPPTAGADLPPHFGYPLQPTFGFAAPPVGLSSGGGGNGYPFIGSNPTVPLPTGMTDTTTVLPMPDTAAKVVGHAASVRVQITMVGLAALFFSILFLLSSTS